MENFVTITANQEGKVVIATSNPEFGFIRVESEQTIMEGGWLRPSKRSALLNGKVADLEKMNFKAGQKISGKIIVKETTEKSYDNEQPKRAGKDGDVITHNGAPVYRNAYYTADLSATDSLLASDKVAATVSAAIVANSTIVSA